MDMLGAKIILKARVTFVFRGYGDLMITDQALIWNKSATSFLTFGALNLATDNHTCIPIDDISKIDTYTYIGSGGLLVITKTGQEFKFSFKHKKDFKIALDYLNSRITGGDENEKSQNIN